MPNDALENDERHSSTPKKNEGKVGKHRVTWTRRPPSRASKFTIVVPSGEDARTPVQLASTWNARPGIGGKNTLADALPERSARGRTLTGRPDSRSVMPEMIRGSIEKEVEGILTQRRAKKSYIRVDAQHTWLLLV